MSTRTTDVEEVDESLGFPESVEAFEAEGAAYTAQESRRSGGDYSLIDEFAEAASEDITNIILLPVTSRKGDWVLEFDAVADEAELKRYNEGAALGKVRRGKDRKSSPALMYAMLIAEKNTAIYKGSGPDREQLFDSDDDAMLLNSDEFLEMVGIPNDVRAAIRKFLGDAGTNSIGAAILEAAGWAEDLTPLDPTER